MIVIAGLDIARRSGVAMAAYEDSGYEIWRKVGIIEFEELRGIVRAQRIAHAIGSWLTSQEQPADIIYIEGYGYGNHHSLADLVEMGTAVRLKLAEIGLQWFDVSPSHLKKWTTGKGNAYKKDMAASVDQQWQLGAKHHDAVDAYALVRFGKAQQEKNPLRHKENQ